MHCATRIVLMRCGGKPCKYESQSNCGCFSAKIIRETRCNNQIIWQLQQVCGFLFVVDAAAVATTTSSTTSRTGDAESWSSLEWAYRWNFDERRTSFRILSELGLPNGWTLLTQAKD